jgi:hypothetical protein
MAREVLSSNPGYVHWFGQYVKQLVGNVTGSGELGSF